MNYLSWGVEERRPFAGRLNSLSGREGARSGTWPCVYKPICRTPVCVCAPWSSGSCRGMWVFVRAGGPVWTRVCWGMSVRLSVTSPVTLWAPFSAHRPQTPTPSPSLLLSSVSLLPGPRPLLPLSPPSSSLLLCNRDPRVLLAQGTAPWVEKGLGARAGASRGHSEPLH